MTPIDIALMTVAGVLFGLLAYFAHSASRDMREMQKWWSDYNSQMQRIQQRLNDYDGSRGMAKQPRAVVNGATREDVDKVIFLNAVSEE